jgi:hypothetical protein
LNPHASGAHLPARSRGHRALAVARAAGYPAGEVLALGNLSLNASYVGDHHTAVQLARQARQTPADIAGEIARGNDLILTASLTAAGNLAEAQLVCAAGLARSRKADDLWNQARLLVTHDLLAGAAGFEAVRMYEHHREREGIIEHHALGKELLAGFAAAEVDKHLDSGRFGHLDRDQARLQAQQQADYLWQQQYGRY